MEINPRPQNEAEVESNMRTVGFARFRQQWQKYAVIGLVVILACCAAFFHATGGGYGD